MKTSDYVYNDDDQAISHWMKNFTSRQGDGEGDPEEAYLQTVEIMAACAHTNWLEIGCGFGRMLPFVIKHSKSVIGIEPDLHRFQECHRGYHAPEKGITILNASSSDYRESNPNAKHGAISVSMVIQHVSTQVCRAILSDIHALLDDTGVAIISTTQNPVELFAYQKDSRPKTSAEYDEYTTKPKEAQFGLPVRKFSKESFLNELRASKLEVVAWNQFSYIRPEKVDWFANEYKLPAADLANVADSQYAIVRKMAR